MKFKPASDDELRKNGWEPKWIVVDPEREGPYAVTRDPGSACGHCGSPVIGWTVVNLEKACGVSTTWTHKEAEVAAHEHAYLLNLAWMEGHAAAECELLDRPAGEREGE